MEIINCRRYRLVFTPHGSTDADFHDWQKSFQKKNKPLGLIKILFAIVIATIAVALRLSAVQPISAQSVSEGLTIDPVFQDLPLNEGDEISSTIFISNTTAEPQEIAVSAIDITQENLTGKLIFLAEDLVGYPHSLAPYITFDKDKFIIPPYAQEKLLVTIEDRDSLRPGGHYAAIVVKAESSSTTDRTTVLPGLASVFLLRKTGNLTIDYELQSLSGLNKLQFAMPNEINMRFDNTGNTHITPRGIVKLSGWQGRIISQTILNPESSVIFPDTQRSLRTYLSPQTQLWIIEPLKLEFSYRDNSEDELKVQFISGWFIHPGILFALLTTVGLGLLLIIWNNRKKIRKHKTLVAAILVMLTLPVFFPTAVQGQTAPVSTNYTLKDFAWGGGGTSGSSSNSYSALGILGELSSSSLDSTNYHSWTGLTYTMMANVPPAPNLNNPANYFDRLEIILATANNPTDAQYAIAISTDGFTTTNWVKADGTLTATLTNAEWQTHAAWGGGSGTDIVGLTANTTYTAKVKARHGGYTESPLGPADSADTETLSVEFDIDVHSTDTETSPPYQLSLNELTTNTITTGSQSIWIDLTTNAGNGATVYINGDNGGLQSTKTSHLLNSVSDDLDNQTEGMGLQISNVTQGSGGPLAKVSPYNGAGDVVGLVPLQLESIFTTPGAIVNGRGSIVVKAKAGEITPAATDYSETLTMVVMPSF
jgi:hypothetical protein